MLENGMETKELENTLENNKTKLCKTRKKNHGNEDYEKNAGMTAGVRRKQETKYCGEDDYWETTPEEN